jgi:hypothetical protein
VIFDNTDVARSQIQGQPVQPEGVLQPEFAQLLAK